VFILFIAAAGELAMMFVTVRTLDNAVDMAARSIRIGDPEILRGGAANFKGAICARMPSFTRCNSALSVAVFSSETAAGLTAPATPTGAATSFSPGGPASYVAVTATLPWEVVNPTFGFYQLPKDTFVLSAQTAFRSEPYPAVTP
jgi:hypothetical protein